MKIYVVIGHTGEYDSYREWLVKAYKDEKQAQNHVKLADEKAVKIGTYLKELRIEHTLKGKDQRPNTYNQWIDRDVYKAKRKRVLKSNPYDVRMEIDLGDEFAEYYYSEVEADLS